VNAVVSVEMNEEQLGNLNRRLERFADSIERPIEANRQASIALYGWTLRNFNQQGALQGGWAPLAPRTIIQKARIRKEVPLVRSGALRSNFTQFYSDDNAGVGNQLRYSRFHHDGTEHIPQRELLPRRDVVLRIGIRVYEAYIARQVARANNA
jgi:phage gpG-like protein